LRAERLLVEEVGKRFANLFFIIESLSQTKAVKIDVLAFVL
jgi:hypothetical protein